MSCLKHILIMIPHGDTEITEAAKKKEYEVDFQIFSLRSLCTRALCEKYLGLIALLGLFLPRLLLLWQLLPWLVLLLFCRAFFSGFFRPIRLSAL